MNAKALKLRLFFALGDIFHLCFSFILSYRLVFFTINISQKYLFLLIILCLTWLLVGSFFRLFDYDRAARTEIMLSNQITPFNDSCNIYAPEYRQATYFSYFAKNSDGTKAHDLAFEAWYFVYISKLIVEHEEHPDYVT